VFHVKTVDILNEVKGLTLNEGESIQKLETGRKFFVVLTDQGRMFGFGMNK